jgi:hypothetical protein
MKMHRLQDTRMVRFMYAIDRPAYYDGYEASKNVRALTAYGGIAWIYTRLRVVKMNIIHSFTKPRCHSRLSH